MLDVINAFQIGSTLTFILFCALLIALWFDSFVSAVQSGEKWTPEQWLIVGIVVGFAGNALDNSFWGLVWLAEYFDSDWQPWLYDRGPLANLFFRQIPGICAVYFHIRAAYGMTQNSVKVHNHMIAYCFLGLIASVLLLVY